MTDTSTESNQATVAKIAIKPYLPKRLIALLVVYTLSAISGLIAANSLADLSAMLCILTLMMVLAILGRQKAGLYLLRVYCVLQLLLYSLLPIIMYDPDNLVAGPTTFDFGFFQTVVADWVIYSVLIALGIIQVWISFNAKVKAWFKPRMNLNIMSS
ncbi:hypothetical protein [Shewanella polaris]|uniref:Uncharacterized protein n=1 Tax=Shewanella polaris TaxID=2588449 RepID=A0A4Y5YC60_9GAMM|nr:hypothetical protein [Shewanella polaris]QDE30371.1 hypothetical protein FH971_04905 [Shewanella polaris]